MSVAELELDLDVFTGPFDLLLALVLREEVDLLEVSLADVVLAYLDHLEAKGELDLEQATEFLVLVAALLELKSRMMLPREEEELLDFDPGEAAEELLARMLEAKRYRGAADDLKHRLAGEEGIRYRSAPAPSWLKRPDLAELDAVYDPARLGAALGTLLKPPAEVSLHHVTIHLVTVEERLTALRKLMRRAGRTFSFDEAVKGADRVTVAVTVWALLELYRKGEATWEQQEPFADIMIHALEPGEARWDDSEAAA
jgi:segregation and condensation protein A